MIRDALANLVAVQTAITITAPSALGVRKAYTYFPDPQIEIPTRSFQNEWTMGEVKAEQAVRTLPYQIRTQFLAGEMLSDTAKNEDIATAFWEAYVDAVCASVRSGGQFEGLILRLRGAEPTLGVIQRNGKAFVGFESFLAVDLSTGINWA